MSDLNQAIVEAIWKLNKTDGEGMAIAADLQSAAEGVFLPENVEIHKNDITDIPAAACGYCGGWTNYGGMSQHANTEKPYKGRMGCRGNCQQWDRDEARTSLITS